MVEAVHREEFGTVQISTQSQNIEEEEYPEELEDADIEQCNRELERMVLWELVWCESERGRVMK